MTRPLRTIAVDVTPILPGGENGGAKVFVLELLRRMAELAPETELVLLTHSGSYEELVSMDRSNVRRRLVIPPVEAQPRWSWLLNRVSRAFPRLYSGLRGAAGRLGLRPGKAGRGGTGPQHSQVWADLLFCPFTAPTYFDARIPTVCTIYDLQFKAYPEFFSAEDLAHRDRIFVDACRRATVLAAISDYSRGSAIAHGRIDPARIRTIPLRLARRSLQGSVDGDVVLHRLGLAKQRYLLYPANFWRHKNHEMLLTAFGMACRQAMPPDFKLVCTGAPGARQEWLMGAARAMNLADRVLFPGFLPDLELTALMASSRGMVFPSLYEGFGIPVIEAMASGIPVACSNVASLPEVAAGAAILFDPKIPTQLVQTMISLVLDDSLRERLIAAGRQRALDFVDSTRMASEYLELFHYALAHPRLQTTDGCLLR